MTNSLNPNKFMFKSELAVQLNLSPRALSDLLNKELFYRLKVTGYRPTHKRISPRQLKIVIAYFEN